MPAQRMRCATALGVVSLLLSAVGASADFLEVRRSATLKANPQRDAAIRARPQPAERMPLLDDGQQTNGYYRARSRAVETDGWIYRTLVRRHPGNIPGALVGLDAELGHCPLGCPAGAPQGNDLVQREIYSLSSNPKTKFADWVAYRITEDTIGPTRSRSWKGDPDISADRTLEPADYTGANAALHTDRGHQAPLASFTGTEHWRDTNFLSNITPQKSDLNQGPWNHLEGAIRELAKEASVEAVFVTTGPLYESDMPPLPGTTKKHRVPSGYWKVVAIEPGDTIKVAAFAFQQDTPRSDRFCNHQVSVRTIEKRSELDFFRELEDSREELIEDRVGRLGQMLGCD